MSAAKTLHANRGDVRDRAAQLSAASAGGGGAPPPPPAPLAERLEEARAAKAEGTERFKQGEVDVAAERYMKAARLLRECSGGGGGGGAEVEVEDVDELKAARELRVVCLVNLAMCRLRQERAHDAIEACDDAIAIDDGAGKAWFRRGQACVALGFTKGIV